MSDPENQEWKDMKSQWQSSSIAQALMTEKLRWSLRLRMLGSWLFVALEVTGFLVLLVLAGIQIAMEHIAIAVALTALNLAALAASLWARRSPLRSAKGSLMELIDLTIHRARRSERLAWAQYFTTAACIAYVLTLYFSDIGDPSAAYHDGDRVAVALVIFVLYAGGVGFYHAYARRRARRFIELRRSFARPEAA